MSALQNEQEIMPRFALKNIRKECEKTAQKVILQIIKKVKKNVTWSYKFWIVLHPLRPPALGAGQSHIVHSTYKVEII